MNWIDLFFLVLTAFFIYRGITQGLIKSLISFFGVAVAAIVSHLYHPIVKEMLIKLTTIDDQVNRVITQRLQDLGAQVAQSVVSVSDLNAVMALPLPRVIKDQLVNHLIATTTTATNNVATVMSDMVLSLIAIVSLFVLFSITIKILASVLNITAKLPVLKSFNATGGALVGFTVAYAMCSVIALALVTYLTLKGHPALELQMANSLLAPLLVEKNMLIVFLEFYRSR
jgi:uncharacterized membrane protein required for colicin V production